MNKYILFDKVSVIANQKIVYRYRQSYFRDQIAIGDRNLLKRSRDAQNQPSRRDRKKRDIFRDLFSYQHWYQFLKNQS